MRLGARCGVHPPNDPDVRFEVAKKIVQRAMDHGIPAADVVVDPLVMPIGALGGASGIEDLK